MSEVARWRQMSRQWLLIQLLCRSGKGCSVDDLAERLECTRRTIYRDLVALEQAGFPLQTWHQSMRHHQPPLYSFAPNFDLFKFFSQKHEACPSPSHSAERLSA